MALAALPSYFGNEILDKTTSTPPGLSANISLLPPVVVHGLLVTIFFTLCRANVFFVKIFEVIAVMVFSHECFLVSRAFGIVAREGIAFISMDIFVVSFEISGSSEYVLFSWAWARVLAWKPISLDSPVRNHISSIRIIVVT